MEKHLEKKNHEADQLIERSRKSNGEKVQSDLLYEMENEDAKHERAVRENAMRDMMGTLHTKRNAIQRRADFERWRHEVALEAANEAFQGSAGRLRKLYAVEKLAGNCLQKITFEQVEKSQSTEDGFQKIREVTGLTDVMDIVHKFLNRDVEHEQLKSSVKEAESKLESLREEYEHFKRETEGMTFENGGLSRKIHQEVEDCETHLGKCLHEHDQSRERLQKTTLDLEQMKAWCRRQNQSLLPFEDSMHIESPQQIRDYIV